MRHVDVELRIRDLKGVCMLIGVCCDWLRNQNQDLYMKERVKELVRDLLDAIYDTDLYQNTDL